MNTVALSLGSNLGDRSSNIINTVKTLEKKFKTRVKKSSVYETPPLYYDGPEFFYNCCISFKTGMSAEEIFDITSSIEKDVRKKAIKRNEPREVDIDIVFIGDMIIADDKLTVPHPGIQDRLFVLKPLSEILPNFVHPAMQLTVTEMLYECLDRSKIKKIKGFWGKKS
ncbi:MAG: 2-amino-4-hydroxy-6-hydroxymethyldihydropteridine diphosphokinase [Elusimicrobia bacterium]|nr:2-amino-4-hydroxy-6-hydroxymethyldihydropteridine diphosphokinase [Elusimicrobiota bacterium]